MDLRSEAFLVRHGKLSGESGAGRRSCKQTPVCDLPSQQNEITLFEKDQLSLSFCSHKKARHEGATGFFLDQSRPLRN